jgi:hypothetical protein
MYEPSANEFHSEEEDPDEYPFPLTLRKQQPGGNSPLNNMPLNGSGAVN